MRPGQLLSFALVALGALCATPARAWQIEDPLQQLRRVDLRQPLPGHRLGLQDGHVFLHALAQQAVLVDRELVPLRQGNPPAIVRPHFHV